MKYLVMCEGPNEKETNGTHAKDEHYLAELLK